MRLTTPETLAREARNMAQADLRQRQGATTILQPEALLAGKKAGSAAVKRLMTTLGGQIRPLTIEDLKTFKAAVERLQSERKQLGGITAGEVIAGSRAEDRQRATAEIHHAVPYRFAGGVMSLQVNASRQNGATRHIVQIELGGWSQAVASPATPLAAAKLAGEQPLKFECSCSRHKYWFRYIATIGGWNFGRPETGLPKIRNPGLTGVACKHVLRVMAELNGAGLRQQIARAVQQERQRLAGKTRKTVVTVRRPDAEALLKKQQAKPRDVQRMADKFGRLLRGKAPAASINLGQGRAALEREAALTRARLLGLRVPRPQVEQIVAAILATGAQA